MMDPINLSLADGLEAGQQNGVHEELSNSGKDDVLSNVDPSVTEIIETAAPNGNVQNLYQSDSTTTDHSSLAEIKEGSNDSTDGNNITISKEEEAKIMDRTEQLGNRKGPVKIKNAKSPSPSGVHASSVKTCKDKKDEEAASAVSNGASALDSQSHPRKPVKNRSLGDKQTRLSEHPGKSDAVPSESPMEKTRPRLLKKGPHDIPKEVESSSPTAEDAKPHRAGALPNYGFSFRCDERAARRKEFYSKLEEKIHAKEVEESNLQAKTKESQEAEIKLLRKSLAFKATPMPSFYQEPPPPRVELKKIPTTRAKSPKLGRRKTSTSSESERTASSIAQQNRLSLDEKVSQSNPSKGTTTPIYQKKPQRRSLPTRLTSERISSSNSRTVRTSPKAVNGEKTSLSSVTTEITSLPSATEEEKVEVAAATEVNTALSKETKEALPPNADPGEPKPHVNGDIVIEEKPLLASVLEPIAAEH